MCDAHPVVYTSSNNGQSNPSNHKEHTIYGMDKSVAVRKESQLRSCDGDALFGANLVQCGLPPMFKPNILWWVSLPIDYEPEQISSGKSYPLRWCDVLPIKMNSLTSPKFLFEGERKLIHPYPLVSTERT
jgi:hypothetical protein